MHPKVRDSGMADIHLLDQKIQDLVSSMNQQTEVIEQINGDLQQQKEVSKYHWLSTSLWMHVATSVQCNESPR